MTNSAKKIELEHRVDLYIPSQCICGGELPQRLRNKVIEEVKAQFDGWFGSHAEMDIKGDWRLPDGTMAKEEVADIYSFCTVAAMEEHQEDVDRLAVQIANSLTQERVLRVFDNLKAALYPNTLVPPPVPRKTCACSGKAYGIPGARSEPVAPKRADRISKMLIIQGMLRSFSSIEHARRLFCDVLNYHYASGEWPVSKWPDGIQGFLTGPPALLADHNGFKVIYIQLSSDSLLRSAERQIIQRFFKDDPTFRGLVIFSDRPEKQWELVNIKTREDDSRRMVLRRMRVGIDAVRTATERLATVEIGEAEESSITAEDLQVRHEKAFDVETVTKAFFIDIANWYFWALKHVRFPKDAPKEKDGRDHVSVIRLITRLIFCWFMKQKHLLPDDLFNEPKLAHLLVGFAPRKVSDKHSVFYRSILQNLFFATLNTEMDKRAWRHNGQNFMAHSLYRHRDIFIRPDEALALFRNIPFLNGGLFECLDKILGEKDKAIYVRVDGFSDREDSQPTVPDFLFFGGERELDLSQEYGSKKFKKVKVRGLIHTLNHYHFTVEESTPLEEEVALDPELAGKIFENLLAAYNPETGTTARKQTGSFYTPREIVNYMVDEALIAYLKGKLGQGFPEASEIEDRLRNLFSYDEEGHLFTEAEVETLIRSIDSLKVLDPAVGSGAFPMGILHKLVFILARLDPRNERWKERQKQRLQEAIIAAERIEDLTIRENTLTELEQQIVGLEDAFEKNTLDYGRKLYLIENSLYGVDIQPIAVQIAKMRFFISLIADQKVNPSAENLSVRPLPNLETKMVAANTLIGIEKPVQMSLRSPRIDALEAELRRVRERHFLARTTATKNKCRAQDKRLRTEIADLLQRDGWPNTTAKQLASWDPYDQNTSADFFDPEWMFGVTKGFDIVIGNPPYVRVDELPVEDKQRYRLFYEATKGKYDLYYLFIENGFQRLCSQGSLSFITPNKYCAATSASKLRSIIFKRTSVGAIVSTSKLGVFEEAANYPVISHLQTNEASKRHLTIREAISIDKIQESSRNSYQLETSEFGMLPNSIIPINVDQSEITFAIRLLIAHPTLGNCLSISEGLRIPRAYEKEEHSDYLILKQYQFDRWTEIRQGSYISERNLKKVVGTSSERFIKINKPKIVIAEDGLQINATIDTKKCVPQGGVYFGVLTKDHFRLDYVLGILNSKLLSCLYEILFGGMHMGGGYLRYRTSFLEALPFPGDKGIEEKVICDLTNKILVTRKKDSSADISVFERELDRQVYALYGLTLDEIKLVEKGR